MSLGCLHASANRALTLGNFRVDFARELFPPVYVDDKPSLHNGVADRTLDHGII